MFFIDKPMQIVKYWHHRWHHTCAGVLRDDREVALLARDAVRQSRAVRRHEATINSIDVELERTAGNRLVVVRNLQ